MREVMFVQALGEAMAEEMERDPRVILMGEDVQLGAFGQTRGLVERFGPGRVRNTPLAEVGFTGAGIGAAASGLRPVVNIMMANFLYVTMDQIVNQLAKLRYMSGGQVDFPIVIWATTGAGGSAAAQHSDNPAAMFVNVPGLKIVKPGNPYDVKGLMKSSIRSNSPIIFFEETTLGMMKQPIPDEEYTVPIGKGEVKREGTDITVVAIGCMVSQALSAAEKLEKEGISVEVVDPRTLVPLDKDIILNSVAKTGKVVVCDDAPPLCSVASEISATINEEGFDFLKAPVARVTREHVPVPFSPPMEKFVLPNEEKIINKVKEVAKR
ncbi:pyruvate dehydrogenase subunit beta [Petrotoga mexicana DSM 14811]|uniref:Pyruvate dehydrogenase subunit beta n=1 Tax=Petrotoga mexicana DSM 14811 TaxID=1122954 RepID=A0A2K1P9F2_9BACT|nr:alpha-ketoacid dehydrogenase subunit beta [Petrotoga mexicana]PNR99425.1 pyruvate dehydrogenase subunit beta [Petrotoga mexicana DSM 14811]